MRPSFCKLRIEIADVNKEVDKKKKKKGNQRAQDKDVGLGQPGKELK